MHLILLPHSKFSTYSIGSSSPVIWFGSAPGSSHPSLYICSASFITLKTVPILNFTASSPGEQVYSVICLSHIIHLFFQFLFFSFRHQPSNPSGLFRRQTFPSITQYPVQQSHFLCNFILHSDRLRMARSHRRQKIWWDLMNFTISICTICFVQDLNRRKFTGWHVRLLKECMIRRQSSNG